MNSQTNCVSTDESLGKRLGCDGVRVWSVQAEQLYSCNQNLLDLVLEAFQLVALLHDLQSGGGGALKGLGFLGL